MSARFPALAEVLQDGQDLRQAGVALLADLRSSDLAIGAYLRTDASHCVPPSSPEGRLLSDALPLSTTAVAEYAGSLAGVCSGVQAWIVLAAAALSVRYAASYSSHPVSLPRLQTLSTLQCEVASHLRQSVERFLAVCELPATPPSVAWERLCSKPFGYDGEPIAVAQELEPELVTPCWPSRGRAARQPVLGLWSRRWLT